MKRFRIPVAAAVTLLALVFVLGAAGALLARNALAAALDPGRFWGAGLWDGDPWAGHPWAGGAGFGWLTGAGVELPPELQGLRDLPPHQRFSHFVGAQISLKDKDGRPLTVGVTPGTVTAASDTSLTIAANDGTTKSYVLDEHTLVHGVHGAPAQGAQSEAPATPPTPATQATRAAPAARPTLAAGKPVVIVTLNNSTTAAAVLAATAIGDGSGWHHHFGGWGPWGR